MHGGGPSIFPDDDVLCEIGRVAVAANSLESVIARFHAILLDEHDLAVVVTWPGAKVRREVIDGARRLLSATSGQKVGEWVREAEALAADRDRTVHAYAIVTWADDGSWRTSALHPRSGTFQLQDSEAMRALALRISDCGTRGMRLLVELAEAGEIRRPNRPPWREP